MGCVNTFNKKIYHLRAHAGHDNGDMVQWDMKTQKKMKMSSEHNGLISDIQPSKDGTMFITASKVGVILTYLSSLYPYPYRLQNTNI